MRVCPICGSKQLDRLFSLPDIPVLVNALPDSVDDAKKFLKGTQSLSLCRKCGFVFNSTFEPEKMMYRSGYHNERGCSPFYLRHIHHILDFIEQTKPIKDQRLLEVACGQGEFLSETIKHNPKISIGVDPSAYMIDKGVLHLQNVLFDETYLKHMAYPADILINRHMIEHIQNPLEMLRLFRCALADDGILYLETPRLDWILENRVFFDFPYEHCSYYSDAFIARLLKMAGFEIVAFERSYAGQYFSICAKKCAPQMIPSSDIETELLQIRKSFSAMSQTYTDLNREEYVKNFYTEIVEAANVASNVFSQSPARFYIWGASAKGVMCANLLNRWPIIGLIDQNLYKQGKFVPGTGQLVMSPNDIPSDSTVQVILVANDAYLDEIRLVVEKIAPYVQVYSLSRLLTR